MYLRAAERDGSRRLVRFGNGDAGSDGGSCWTSGVSAILITVKNCRIRYRTAMLLPARVVWRRAKIDAVAQTTS